MSTIGIHGLSFYYSGSHDYIFKDVSLSLDGSWKLGLIGRNGRGKTTFLKLLMDKYTYEGNISTALSFEYFPYPISDSSQLVIDIMQQICMAEQWQMERELNLLDTKPEILWRPYDTLSGGEQTKVQLAALFLRENQFLLIDEPTNHLDSDARLALAEYLNSKSGFILVSHDRVFLDGCIDHILSINRQTIDVQQGNFSSWQLNKDRQDNYEFAQNEQLKKDIGRLEDASTRTAGWSDKIESTKKGRHAGGMKVDRGFIGAKAASMMKRSLSTDRRRQEAIDDKSKLLKDVESADDLFLQPLTHPLHQLAQLEDVSISYADKPIFEHFDLSIEQGERIALTGKNGCGKSSVLKLLTKELSTETGHAHTAADLKISYVPQSSAHLAGDLSAFANDYDIDYSLFLTILRKLDFERAQFAKPMEEYSMGQRKKVLLARSFCEQAHLYIWDEPLNYIDVLSRIQIEEAIMRSEATMLFVEHDVAFARDVATRTIQM